MGGGKLMLGGEPFFYPGGEVGCLLIHGFTGSPAEVKALGQAIAEDGFTVLGVRLAGHGTTPWDMAKTNENDWLGSVEEGFDQLSKTCPRIFLIGFSMGGLLALHLAHRPQVCGLITINTPIFLANRKVRFLRILRWFQQYRPKRLGDSMYRTEFAQERVSYDVTPLRCVDGLLRLIVQGKKLLPSIGVPAFIVQSTLDRQVKKDSGTYILSQLGSKDKRLQFYHQSGHLITYDHDREQLTIDLRHWLQEQIKLGGGK